MAKEGPPNICYLCCFEHVLRAVESKRRTGIARERQEMEEIKNEEDEKGREQREGGPYLLYPLIHIT